ncbi:MAG TPA: menaquinol-cytochrome c reductase cytochrome b subunit [Acidimicrobiales bacterium]|nr:menaquinol-cytochrome c reductase cytochrome b subunit [Acidimicrobiales bacterium]
MAEVPEHLLRRAAERKAALEAKKAEEAAAAGGGGETAEAAAPATPAAAPAAGAGAPSPDEVAASNAEAEKTGKIPAHLLARSAAARAAGASGQSDAGAGGGGGATTATAAPATAAGAAATAARVTGAQPGPGLVGPAGHTQRLLTVVKAGSIQDVRSTPTDKVHVWPHLLVVEFVASLAMTAFLLVFSTFVNAPLLGTANYNLTPNPSKAPWYFLGLQELLTLFHPMVAGVMIPGVGLVGLGMAGYIDKNPSHKPEDRKFAIALFTFFMMFWAVLVIIGSVFRGEGQNFIYPWRQGVHEIFEL